MSTVKNTRRIQVDGKRYTVIEEDAKIEKLIKKGLRIKGELSNLKGELDSIHHELTCIANERRQETTTVTLKGVTTRALITYREKYEPRGDLAALSPQLGPLFNRFFSREETFKVKKELKKFLSSEHALGMDNADEIKEEILKYLMVTEIKPSVKIEEGK